MRTTFLAVAMLITLGGCVEVGQLTFSCEADGSCASGLSCCSDRLCRATCAATDAGAGVDAGEDAGTIDAGIDAGCGTLLVEYGTAVQRTKQCNPNSLVEPCTETRPAVIGCTCLTFINAGSGATLDALQARFTANGCTPLCPACTVVDAGTCTAVVGGGLDEGVCIDR